MLLYNQRKEFIGIDEDDLSALDFQSISELQSESHDFADLFVKKPGYIHNFKNFSWIDFILHSESDESKAIVHAKGKNYSCSLHITPFHFTADESGYAVIIKNLNLLKGAQDAQASKDLEAAGGIKSSPAPASTARQEHLENMPDLDIFLENIKMSNQPEPSLSEGSLSIDENLEISESELPNFEQSHTQELNEPEPLDIPEQLEADFSSTLSRENEFGTPIDIDYNAPLDINEDLMQDTYEEPMHEEEFTSEVLDESIKQEEPMLGDYVSSDDSDEHLSDLVKSGNYQYDPNIAANELGLPVDLIEEFIGDFIEQAHEFHDDLYASVNADDFDNVQILSHKLKGVAANLRVEDAFDVLSVVNISKDTQEILPNLNQFYKIIAKLEGKEIPVASPVPLEVPVAIAEPEPIEEALPPAEEKIDYNIGIKQDDEGPLLIDEEVLVEDDIYDDLLGSSDHLMQEEPSITASDEVEDDIYDDLLGSSDHLIQEEPSMTASNEVEDDIYDDLLRSSDHLMQEEPSMTASNEVEDDIYDDLTLTPDLAKDSEVPSSLEEEIIPPLQDEQSYAAPEDEISIEAEDIERPELNFDTQRAANELGIPLDIVKDFVQDFKSQVNLHQNDFKSALESQNIQEINKTATLLKGMSDNLRLNEISEVLKELQSEKDINNTAQALALLQAYADQL